MASEGSGVDQWPPEGGDKNDMIPILKALYRQVDKMHSSLAEVNHKVDTLQASMNEIRGNFDLEDKKSNWRRHTSSESTGSGHLIVSHINQDGQQTNVPSSPLLSSPLQKRQSQPYSHTGPYRKQSALDTEPVVNGPSNGLHTPTNSPAEDMFASSTDTKIANHQDEKVTIGPNASKDFIKVDGVRFAEESKVEDKTKTQPVSAGQDTLEHGKFGYQSPQFEFKHATHLTVSPKTNIEAGETIPQPVTNRDNDNTNKPYSDQEQEDAIKGIDTAQSQKQVLDKHELYQQTQEQDRHSLDTPESTGFNSLSSTQGPTEQMDVEDSGTHKDTTRRGTTCPVNFGSSPLPTRSQSPPPKEYRGNWSYSNLKRKLTDKSEDNRSKYFVTEEMVPIPPAPQGLTHIGAPIPGQPYPLPMGSSFRNNSQLTVSGFKNEHGDEDNRFQEEAHETSQSSSMYRPGHSRMSNLSAIRNGGRMPVRISNMDTNSQAQSLEHNKPDTLEHDQPEPQSSSVGEPQVTDTSTSQGDDDKPVKPNTGTEAQPAGPTILTDEQLQILLEHEKNEGAACSDTRAKGIDTVICLDTSASMKGPLLRQAKAFILKFVDGLETAAGDFELEENVAIVTFGKKNAIVQHLTNNYDAVRETVESITEVGEPSPLWLGLALSLTEITVRGGACTMSNLSVKPRIILVTDGFATKRNILTGPDNRNVDKEACNSVVDLLKRNSGNFGQLECMTVGDYNNVLLRSIAPGRIYETYETQFLTQHFRKMDAANTMISKCRDKPLSDEEIVTALQPLELAKASNDEILKIVRQKGPFTAGSNVSRTSPKPNKLPTMAGESQTPVRQQTPDHEKTVQAKNRSNTSSPHLTLSADQSMNTSMETSLTEPQTPEIDDVPALQFGCHVKPDPGWVGHAARHNFIGTVLGTRKRGLIKILWSDGTTEKCRYGVSGQYDIRPDLDIDMGDTMGTGAIVERGPHWNWKDQDGGPGSIGVVLKLVNDDKVAHVIWAKGVQGNYRYGFKNKYDVQICKPKPIGDEKVADAVKPAACWEIETSEDGWRPLPQDVSNVIEEKYNITPLQGTFIVTVNDTQYRIILTSTSLKAKNLATQEQCPLRRTDTKEE